MTIVVLWQSLLLAKKRLAEVVAMGNFNVVNMQIQQCMLPECWLQESMIS